ncbi:hypothetical protein BKA65DRAFT_244205 [Rhexocercosporidium sp. MPI-PUGE-AT-0058]|nr:hypothetical protein BKA65DRAFT_244205 [Rhexocercosporidium sp. MPI-PUGE-AT-0058]
MSLSLVSCCPTSSSTNTYAAKAAKSCSSAATNIRISDRAAHEGACNAVKKAETKCTEEERKVRNVPGDWKFQANPTKNSVSHFWGILETRDYMRARYGVIDALLKLRHQEP